MVSEREGPERYAVSPLLVRALTMPRQSLPKRGQGQKLKSRLTFSHVPRKASETR
jgi:hypothetical protein